MKDLVLHFWRSHGALYRIVRIILSVVVFGLVLLMTFEDKLIYFPTRYPDGYWTVRENCEHDGEILPAVEDSRFSTSDGVALHGWYCSPLRCQDGKGLAIDTKIVVLWFHGNAGNISYRYDMIRAMMDIPVQVFIIDYRGYGKSEGVVSGCTSRVGLPDICTKDRAATYRHLREIPGRRSGD